jgi:eukaryotic-like serine/threonine-protein kinase
MNIIVDGRYQIVKRLGKGGFAHTYLAKNLTAPDTPHCVVKQLRPKVDHPSVLQLFRLEATILDRFKHSQIPKCLECFEHEGEHFLVQDFIAGDDLSKEFTIGHHWHETKIIDFLREILGVLDYIHQEQVIHCDIKPANIVRRWESGKLCLIDFGAVLDVGNRSTHPDVTIGTPGYQAPEQAKGEATFSSDIYGLGMTAIQFITGQYPLYIPRNENRELLWQDLRKISDRLAIIIDRTIEFDVANRYQSTAAVLKDLDALSIVSSSFSKTTQLQELDGSIKATNFSKTTQLQELDGSIKRPINYKILAIVMFLIVGFISALAILYTAHILEIEPVDRFTVDLQKHY